MEPSPQLLDPILQDHNPWWRRPSARRADGLEFRRPHHDELLRRLLRLEDRRATVLVGPRQVGKTVLLLQIADRLLDDGWPPENLLYFDFSDDRLTTVPDVRSALAATPPGLREDHPRIVLLDEIGLAPRWDRWLKQAVDRGGLRILATDSAATLLRRAAVESGQGRWDELRIEPLGLHEFLRLHQGRGDDAPLVVETPLVERYLSIGGFPEHVLDEDRRRVHDRLRADVVERAIVRDLAREGVDVEQVRRLFVFLVQESGAVFAADNRAQDLHADRRSVSRWLELLLGTALLTELHQSPPKSSARLRGRPKVYAADPGLVAAFSPGPEQSATALRSRLFEAAVFRHLRDLRNAEISYFRRREDVELDFVVETGSETVAVEVTASPSVDPRKLARARSAAEVVGARRLFLVHGGNLDETDGDAVAIPLPRFLLNLPELIEGAP